uniref:Uncharacterized protein n=1 Tax=Candidatus Kentrum sp. FW TaxID=2126338 RepID=A0A450T8C3_9GAMM|nr:MAG: hypothetical protein BECKFW1821B_GA0114236_107721 [Candidatus Kentron sp. FW]
MALPLIGRVRLAVGYMGAKEPYRQTLGIEGPQRLLDVEPKLSAGAIRVFVKQAHQKNVWVSISRMSS